MNKLEEISVKISTNKEILETLPKNNAKNINIYIDKLGELKKEYEVYAEEILEEMKHRVGEVSKVTVSPDIALAESRISNMEENVSILDEVKTSYEKMKFDKYIYDLRYYYKKNLDVVNETVLLCLKKFKEVGINLSLDDFCYSNYVKEYLKVFFEEIEKDNIDPQKIQAKFEEIYWECSDIIMYIELNMRQIYYKNEKTIDKYYVKKEDEILNGNSIEAMINNYLELKKQLIEKKAEDKAIILNGLLNGKLNIKDYSQTIIRDRYCKFISKEAYEAMDEDKLDKLDVNLKQLLNSVYEYKNYLKYKFIIDDVKNIYAEKEKNKNTFMQLKKDILIKEKKIIKLNKKLNEKNAKEQEKLILEVKELYRDLDKSKINQIIANKLDENSTLYDALHLAASFYNYLFDCIINIDKEIAIEEIEKMIEEVREFVNWPYNTITNNVKLLEEKDILLVIKDRYQLLNINISKEDLEEDNLDSLISTIRNLEVAHNIRKNNIEIDKVGNIIEFKKLIENQ